MQEPKIGILGLGSQTTQHYIKRLNQRYQEQTESGRTFPFLLRNIDFHEINKHLPHEMQHVEMQFRDYLNELMAMGLRHLLVPHIGLHELLDEVGLPVSIELLHPLRLTEQKLRELPGRPLMIWSDEHSMQRGYLEQHFEALGESPLRPKPNDVKSIAALCQRAAEGPIQPKEQEAFERLFNRYKDQARILLACTNLSLYDKPDDTGWVLDMAEMQLERALEVQLAAIQSS